MKLIVDISEDVYTRLFDNGIQDLDDVCEMAKALRLGTPLPNRWNRYDDNDPKTWPEDGSLGLWQHKNGRIKVLRWKMDALNHFFPNPYDWYIDEVVAWMPLPEPYKVGK